jgi:hypothetical protein
LLTGIAEDPVEALEIYKDVKEELPSLEHVDIWDENPAIADDVEKKQWYLLYVMDYEAKYGKPASPRLSTSQPAAAAAAAAHRPRSASSTSSDDSFVTATEGLTTEPGEDGRTELWWLHHEPVAVEGEHRW